MARVAAIIPAAGSGVRLGIGVPKALVPLGGRPLVWHAVCGVLASESVDDVVVLAPADELATFTQALAEFGDAVRVVPGGDTRQMSVKAGLRAAHGADIVIIHDAARCLTPPEMIARVVHAVAAGARCVIPGLAVQDTIKTVTTADGHLLAHETLDRSRLRAIQTPQGFPYAEICALHENSSETLALDDAYLAEQAGIPVEIVDGHPDAFKITTPFDLAVATMLLAAGQNQHN